MRIHLSIASISLSAVILPLILFMHVIIRTSASQNFWALLKKRTGDLTLFVVCSRPRLCKSLHLMDELLAIELLLVHFEFIPKTFVSLFPYVRL